MALFLISFSKNVPSIIINKPAKLKVPDYNDCSENFTSPKSHSLNNPSYPRITFSGFKS